MSDPVAAPKPAAPEAASPAETPAPAAPAETPSLYVGELAPTVTEAMLYEIFSGVGSVLSIRVCRDTVTHDSLGYAYVNFQDAADAKKAMQELNYSLINGRPCRIMRSQRDPSARKSGKANVFIKNLDSSIDNKSLDDTFSAFGEILSAKVVTDAQGNSLNFGFIHFATPEAAQEAIDTVNGMVLNGRAVYVAHHVPRVERESQAEAQRAKFTNVYVKNLPEDTTQAKLEEMFAEFGEVTSTHLATNQDGSSRGFGFVNFKTHEDAEKAVEALNDKEVAGKQLYVGRAQNKYERQTELKKRYEAQRLEQLTKYQGVNLYVKNLDDSIDSEKLNEAFTPFGHITSARLMTDDDGKSRGFGFVCYSSPEEANKAISEMNGHMLGSKPLFVTLAQRKDVRTNAMRQQLSARNALRMQQAAQAQAVGMPPFVGGPMVYPGQPPFGAPRMPYTGAAPMMVPRGVPVPQWQVKGAPEQPAKVSLEKQVAHLPEDQQKQVIGEALYPRIAAQDEIDEGLAAKITGMLLDMPNKDLYALDQDDALLREQVQDALEAYRNYLNSQ